MITPYGERFKWWLLEYEELGLARRFQVPSRHAPQWLLAEYSMSAASTTSEHSALGTRKSKDEASVNVNGFDGSLRAPLPRLRGRALTAALAFVAGTGFTLFGCADCRLLRS